MGTHKALLPWRGATVLDAVLAAVAPCCAGAMLLANDREAFLRFGLPVHADIIPGCGPLGGLHAALARATTPSLLVVACDLPLLTADLTRRLLAAAEPGAVTIAFDGRDQPLFGVYPAALEPAAAALLRAGRRAMAALLDPCAAPLRRVDVGDARGQLANLNTPEDYARLAGGTRPPGSGLTSSPA